MLENRSLDIGHLTVDAYFRKIDSFALRLDNASVVYLSFNPVKHQHMKHIEIDLHFIRDQVATGHVHVLRVPSRYQFANIFTKVLPNALFHNFRSSLNVRRSHVTIVGVVSSIYH